MRRSVVRGCVLGLLIAWAWAGRGDANPGARLLADAAKDVYELLQMSLTSGMPAPAEELYLWSKRWYAAERAAAADDAGRAVAAEQHLKRMRLVEKLSRYRRRSGHALPIELARAKYYVFEAELWQTQKVAPPP